MEVFCKKVCRYTSSKKEFGLCDDGNLSHAYIDENDGEKWIAVVDNHYQKNIIFIAIDNCIKFSSKKCDGVLCSDEKVVFVELKNRGGKPKEWKDDAENQLKETILVFENLDKAKEFQIKEAYISNKKVGKHNEKNHQRMEKFKDDTGYVLRIQNRIEI